jgi:hypothetical protein
LTCCGFCGLLPEIFRQTAPAPNPTTAYKEGFVPSGAIDWNARL